MSTHDTPIDNEKSLSLKQQQAALWLAQGTTIAKTAEHVGVNEKTIDYWKKKPAFMEAVRLAEDEIYQDALKLLKRTAKVAIMTLILCLDAKVSNYVRVAAASKLLDSALEVHKLQDLEREVEELKIALGLKELQDE